MFTSWFENGDGLLVICSKEEPEMMRLLMTDSGHYILPTDTSAASEVPQNDKKEVRLAEGNRMSSTLTTTPRSTTTSADPVESKILG